MSEEGVDNRDIDMPHLFEFLLCIWGRILVRVILWTDGLRCYRVLEEIKTEPSLRPCDRPS